ncbi:MAG: protein kinase, partial [Planctomycetes bacterium]|nr:protein kinase [Planctomycetota bacterium]
MSDDHLYDLVIEWDERRQMGEEVSPEILCADQPELLDELKETIASVIASDWMFEPDDDDSDDDFLHLPDFGTVSLQADETQLPACSLNVEEFATAIVESGLMEAKQVEWFRDDHPADDSQSLARQLVEDTKLTRFQASVLLDGRDQPLLLDRYVILDEIGVGGMGVVFKALHREMDRVVALKVLPKTAVDSSDKVKRFRREVKAAAKLEHPNIVTAFDAHESKGIHFLVMSYVNGQDLSQTVCEHGPLPVGKAVNYVLQAARG